MATTLTLCAGIWLVGLGFLVALCQAAARGDKAAARAGSSEFPAEQLAGPRAGKRFVRDGDRLWDLETW